MRTHAASSQKGDAERRKQWAPRDVVRGREKGRNWRIRSSAQLSWRVAVDGVLEFEVVLVGREGSLQGQGGGHVERKRGRFYTYLRTREAGYLTYRE